MKKCIGNCVLCQGVANKSMVNPANCHKRGEYSSFYSQMITLPASIQQGNSQAMVSEGWLAKFKKFLFGI
jgi:hypothetical protein